MKSHGRQSQKHWTSNFLNLTGNHNEWFEKSGVTSLCLTEMRETTIGLSYHKVQKNRGFEKSGFHCTMKCEYKTILQDSHSGYLYIVNDKFLEPIWHQMSRFFVAAIPYAGHKILPFESPSDSVVNTFWLTPAWLEKNTECSVSSQLTPFWNRITF